MNAPAMIFTALAGWLLFRLPRHWAALPLLIGASYMPIGLNIALGPFHFTVIRILVAIGVVRVRLRGEQLSGGFNTLDRLIVCWAVWLICSSCFHKDVAQALVYRLGLAYDALGIYFLFRAFVQDSGSILNIAAVVVIAVVPIAIEMLTETLTGRNSFSWLGGVPPLSEIRGGKIRAQGPFAHSILAGTVGALCLPLPILFWQRHRKLALLGLASTCCIVVCSRSSGPIMTTVFGLMGLGLWRLRTSMPLIRRAGFAGLIALSLVMNAPIYYLIARIDLTGHSTSFYRAFLIDSAIHHLDEWWLGGTDYTRNWTVNGGWTESETDITNHYLRLGVLGGLPAVILFVGMLIVGFRCVGQALRTIQTDGDGQGFVLWTAGSILFAHAATMMSVSYFDQSIVFLYLSFAVVASVQLMPSREKVAMFPRGDERTVGHEEPRLRPTSAAAMSQN